MDATLFFQTLVNGLQLGVVFVLIALGLTLVFSIMHIINFAHGEFYMLGGYALFYFFAQFGVNYFVAIVISMLLVGLIAVLIERGVFRPLRDFPLRALVASLALVMLLQGAGLLGFGPEDRGVPAVVTGTLALGGTIFAKERLMVMGIAGLLVVLLYLFLHRMKLGWAMRAVAQEKEAAALQGISVNRTSAIAFGLGCALAAGAGALAAPMFYIHPFMGSMPVMKAFVVIILGGLGSIPGAVAGGLILGLVESFGTTFAGGVVSSMLSFLILILVLIIRPTGLFGHE